METGQAEIDTLPVTEPRAWTLRDLFQAVPLSFQIQKIFIAAIGLFLAAFIFAFAYWLGLKTGERPALRVFTVVGVILASCLWVLFAGIISRMSLVQLLEGRRMGAGEIRAFVAERWSTLVGTPIVFGLLGLIFLALMAMMELIGALPGLGPIVFAASFLLAFSLALLATLTALVHAMGTFLYPSIVALRGSGAIGVLIEMFDLLRRRGFQLLAYEAVVGAVGALMTALIGTVVWVALYIANWSALSIMKEKFEQSLGAIPDFFRIFLKPFERWLPYVPEPIELPWHYDLSGWLLGLSLLMIVVGTAVYPFIFFNTAGSITYLILRGEDETLPPVP